MNPKEGKERKKVLGADGPNRKPSNKMVRKSCKNILNGVFKTQTITRCKNEYAIMLKHSASRGHKIINMYTSTNTALK